MRFVHGALPLFLAACSIGGDADADGPGLPGQGSGDARTFAASGFDSIDLGGSDDVDVHVGTGFSVRAEGDSDVLDRLWIARDATTLRIRRRSDGGWGWGSGSIKLLVTMPRIVSAKVAGSGDIAIDRVEGSRFDGTVAGSGGLSVDAMQVDEARLRIAGSGDMTAEGTADRLDVSVAGSGNFKGGDLKVKAAKVSVTGSGGVQADLDGTGDVRVTGSGNVDLGRSGHCTVHSVGSGRVRCGG